MARKFAAVNRMHTATLYEVNVRQYTPEGSFNAFARHLPRLAGMGVKMLWFMPVTPISVAGRKGSLGSYYACSDYTAVNPEFGTLEDFKALVASAHDVGMQVIIDWVANHTGTDHVWTQGHPGFYKKNAEGQFYDTHGWDDVIDLNYYDQAMRRAMIDAMEFWIRECDIDGFRCDMAHLVPLDFWKQARTVLDPLKPLFWLGETEDLHYLDVFDSCYGWRWMHATEDFIKKKTDLNALVQLLAQYDTDFPSGTLPLFFTSNHDENSWNGTEYEKYGDAAKLFAVLSFTWRSLPLIYSGQELPSRKRLKFFDKDLIEWNDKLALLPFYKSLIKLRESNPVFVNSQVSKPQWLSTSQHDTVLAFTRKFEGNQLLVVLNCSDREQLFCFSSMEEAGSYKDIFTDQSFELNATGMKLPAWGFAVGVR